MKITQLYTYPIKSLRSVRLTTAVLTPNGLPHDRRFVLLKVHGDGSGKPRSKSHYNPDTKLENMTITYFNELALFLQSISEDGSSFTVTFTSPERQDGPQELKIAFDVQIDHLECIEVDMHNSPTKAYKMDHDINAWFSKCLGYEVILAYLGPHTRKVLGNLAPNIVAGNGSAGQSWLSSMKSKIPSMVSMGVSHEERLTFADIAAYLVITEESLTNVSDRLPDGSEMDVTKFRPNIVLSGASEAWEEDYWGGISISKDTGEEAEIILTQNCGRCVSINIDYATGQPAKGEEGTVLKKMMKDRRVDPGNKWSPIFGRYGFLKAGQAGIMIAVDDEVLVSRRNKERTVFDWPGIG